MNATSHDSTPVPAVTAGSAQDACLNLEALSSPSPDRVSSARSGQMLPPAPRPKRRKGNMLAPPLQRWDVLERSDTLCVHCRKPCGGACEAKGRCGFLFSIVNTYDDTNSAVIYLEKIGLDPNRARAHVEDLCYLEWGFPGAAQVDGRWSVELILTCICEQALSYSSKVACSWAIVAVYLEDAHDEVAYTAEKWSDFRDGLSD